MLYENFRYFALRYLDDWWTDDRHFVAGVQLERDRSHRLATLRRAAIYYKVTRTLPTLDGEERLSAALDAVDHVASPITEETVDDVVCGLASRLKELYGRYAISAASKLLWIRHRWPVVILDDQADLCLRRSGCRFGKGEYRPYRKEWRQQFAEREAQIREACEELQLARGFSRAEVTSDELAELTATPWFRERVFDKYLWANAG